MIDVTRCGEGGPGPKGSVLAATFEMLGQQVIALNGGPRFKFNEAISLSVDCKSQAEVDELWETLSAAVRRANAAGSRTSSACPGRSCPRACRSSWGIPILRKRSASCRQ